MTVPATTRRAGPYTGSGPFPFTFKVFGATDISVVQTLAGVDTTLAPASYSVTLNSDQDATPGGSVTYALPTGAQLTIVGARALAQSTDLPQGGRYSAVTVENALDSIVMQIQQLAESQGRALTLSPSATAGTGLPPPAAGNVIGWDEAAQALRNIDPVTLASVVAYSNRRVFVGDGGAPSYTLAVDPGNTANCIVAVGGVLQTPGVDYTVSGTTLTPTPVWPVGTGNVVVVYGEALPVGVTDTTLVNHVAPEIGAKPSVSLFNIVQERIVLERFAGADPSGATPSTIALQNAIGNAVNRGGADVDLGNGEWLIDGVVDRFPNVYLVGRGPRATRIRSTHNGPVIRANGTNAATVVNRGGVVGVQFTGPGLAQTNSIAVWQAWTNTSILEDIRVFGYYRGIYASNCWQDKWVNIRVDGAGTEQNAIGFYMDAVDPTNQNNAVNASGCIAQGVSLYGWRIVNANGSKLVNCEGLDGVHGFYIGDPPSGSERCRWIHFVNCLADTQTGHNWRFEKGAALAMEQIVMTGCWGGTSFTGTNLYIGGASQIMVGSFMGVAANTHAIRVTGSARCSVAGAVLTFYDGAAAGNAGIALHDSTEIGVSGAHVWTPNAGSSKALAESGTSDNNHAVGNYFHGGYTRTGAASRFMRNQAASAEKRGSATIAAGNTSVTVTHGCEGAPNIDDVRITPRNDWGSATKWWVDNMTSTTFRINVNAAPGGSGLLFNWAIDPIGQ